MGPQEMRTLMKACTQECAPECTAACPVHVDARALCGLVGADNFDKALGDYTRVVLFPRLVGAHCTAPCQTRCKRGEVGQPIAIRQLEESLSRHGRATPPDIKPYLKLSRTAAVVGGGISGLAAALHLYEKGFSVTIFEKEERLGGRGWQLDPVLAELDFAFLNTIPWEVRLGCEVGRDVSLDKLLEQYDGVYCSAGPQLPGGSAWDPVTFQSAYHPKLFVGGSPLRQSEAYSIIDSISSGRRAGISLDRFLKKVSLTASRSNEGSYETELFTDINEGTASSAQVLPEGGAAYTRQEAREEAARCLDCQCLRCTKQCAYLRHYEGYPYTVIREMATHIGMLVGQRQAGPLINSCSLCGLCKELCPNNIEMPASALAARRTLVDKGQNVPAVHDFALRDMGFSNSEAFWLWRPAPGGAETKALFFPGCQLAAVLPQLMQPTYEYLLEKLGGGVGLGLGCCGAPAHWSGYEKRHEGELEAILAAWERLGKPVILTACPTCQQQLSQARPDLPLRSLWEVFAEYGPPESVRADAQPYAIQDACGARGLPQIHGAVREVAAQAGCQIEELRYAHAESKCCNYGGLMTYANKALAAEALAERLAESPRDFLVYCGACREQCQRGGKSTVHILELLFGPQPPVTDITQKRRNRQAVKAAFTRKFWPETNVKQEAGMKLSMTDEVRRRLDERLILEEEVAAVIAAAEKSGKRLRHPETGHFIAHLQPGIITYWAEYEPAPDGYVVYNAYSHRLQIVDD